MEPKTKLLDRMRNVRRLKPMSMMRYPTTPFISLALALPLPSRG